MSLLVEKEADERRMRTILRIAMKNASRELFVNIVMIFPRVLPLLFRFTHHIRVLF